MSTKTIGEGNTTGPVVVYSANPSAPSYASAPSVVSGITFNTATSVSYLISLVSFIFYIVPLTLIDIGEINTKNTLKQYYEDIDYWDSKDEDRYDTYMSYLIPFLISGILFTLTTLIQIYIWYKKLANDNQYPFNISYTLLCQINIGLSIIGCICHAIGLGNFEDDTVGDIKNIDDKKQEAIDEISFVEMMYGGFILMVSLYNLYFTLSLFPQIYNNQFIRLSLSSFVLLFHCICYIPYLADESNDFEDTAEDYGDDYADYYGSDYADALQTYYRSLSASYGIGAGGLIVVSVMCLFIIIINIINIMNGNSGSLGGNGVNGGNDVVNSISQLPAGSFVKKIYMIFVIILVIGLCFYLIAVGTLMSIQYAYDIQTLNFYCEMYIIFGSIIVVTDVGLTYKSIA